MALNNPTINRFVAAGYVTVMLAEVTRPEDPLELPAAAILATVKHVKTMSDVDSDSVAVYGCSFAGGLALALAGEIDVAAVAAEEPSVAWFYDTSGLANPADFRQAREDPHRFFTAEIRGSAREKLRDISAPVLIAQSGADAGSSAGGSAFFGAIFDEILIPDLKAAGKEVEVMTYAGQKHCFGFWATADTGVAPSRFFADMNAFFKRHLPTQPQAVDDSLLEHVPIGPVFGSDTTEQGRAADEEEIRRQVLRFLNAWNGRDAGALARLYTSDARRVIAEGEYNGRDAIETRFAQVFASFPESVKLAATPGAIRFLAPQVAVVQGSYAISGLGRSLRGRFLTVFLQEDGQWFRCEDLSMAYPN